jgi:hypothetical protein
MTDTLTLDSHIIRDSFQTPIVAYDCENEEEVLIRGYPALSAADNPMQAEQCSCQLQNANYFCRTCAVGGTTEFKQSEIGYATLFKVSLPAENMHICLMARLRRLATG